MSVELILKNKNANVVTVPVEKTMILGRGEECDLRIASNNVSRKHCRLEVKGEKVAIRDLGSSNGTYINGKRLPEKKAVKLVDGMVIAIGPMVAKVSIPLDESVEATLAAPEPEPLHPAEMDTAEFEGVIPPEDELDADDDQTIEEHVSEEVAEQEAGEGEDTAFFDQEELDEAIEEEHEVDVEPDVDVDPEVPVIDEEIADEDDSEEVAEADETLIDEVAEETEVEEYEIEDDEPASGMDEFFPEDHLDDGVFGVAEEEIEIESEEDRVDISSNDDESLSDFLKGLE